MTNATGGSNDVDLDELFGPMRPEADDEALYLKGYDTIDPCVLSLIRDMPSEDQSILLEFCDSCPNAVAVEDYAVGLVVGYHLRDPGRRSSGAREQVDQELSKAEKYLGLMLSMERFPTLVSNGESGLIWDYNVQAQETRRRWAAEVTSTLNRLRIATEDPEFAESLLRLQLSQVRGAIEK